MRACAGRTPRADDDPGGPGIAVTRTRDETASTTRSFAISTRDPVLNDCTGHPQLPDSILLEFRRFFQPCSVHGRKEVIVEDVIGLAQAIGILQDAHDMYRRLRRGELGRL